MVIAVVIVWNLNAVSRLLMYFAADIASRQPAAEAQSEKYGVGKRRPSAPVGGRS